MLLYVYKSTLAHTAKTESYLNKIFLTMQSFCAERCQDLFSALTLYHKPPTKKAGKNTWHAVIQEEKIKENLSVHRKGVGLEKNCP